MGPYGLTLPPIFVRVCASRSTKRNSTKREPKEEHGSSPATHIHPLPPASCGRAYTAAPPRSSRTQPRGSPPGRVATWMLLRAPKGVNFSRRSASSRTRPASVTVRMEG
ncbi:hypothetical protein K438DRAFT_1864380, partial [Mycena galopus ATCC 62051]